MLTACGGRGQKRQTPIATHSVEDTVRYQIGGTLYGLDIDPTDSITIIEARYRQAEQGELYREYRFIVHDRHSKGHQKFSESTLGSIHDDYYQNDHRQHLPRLDTVQTNYIDLVIEDFKGYWVWLTAYKGDFYLDDWWTCRRFSIITDSLYIGENCHELIPRKIAEAMPLPGNGISILLADRSIPFTIELIEEERSIYRTNLHEDSFIIPVRAINNFEIIQYTNTTGDLID